MNIIKDIVNFLTNKAFSIPVKILTVIFIVLTLILINDFFGFSFYYSNSQKINQLKTIAELKKNYSNDLNLLSKLENIEDKIFERQNLLSNFLRLTKNETKSQSLNSFNLQDKQYSQPWLTISASFFFLIIFIVIFLTFLIAPFTEKKFNWSVQIGLLIFLLVDIGLIWTFQFLFSFIPIFFNTPWINYSLYIFIWIIAMVLIGKIATKQKKQSSQSSN